MCRKISIKLLLTTSNIPRIVILNKEGDTRSNLDTRKETV
nr:MAG TPA: hypothetical protein [Caudoviricetes sp.]